MHPQLLSSQLSLDALPLRQAQRSSADRQRLEQVCAWIELHLDEEIGWDRLLRVSGVSALELQRLFQRHLRTTPMMHIRTRRQERKVRRA